MKQVIHAVEAIKHIPGALVDCSYLQSRECVAAQLSARAGDQEEEAMVDMLIDSYKEAIEELIQAALPYHIPEDFLFFLRYYGAIVIRKGYRLDTLGIGPMVEEWYSYIMGDDAVSEPRRDGMLTIGRVEPNYVKGQNEEVMYFLDLSGKVYLGGVIGVAYSTSGDREYHEIVQEPERYPERWKLVAHSFTEWLREVAATEGAMGY